MVMMWDNKHWWCFGAALRKCVRGTLTNKSPFVYQHVPGRSGRKLYYSCCSSDSTLRTTSRVCTWHIKLQSVLDFRLVSAACHYYRGVVWAPYDQKLTEVRQIIRGHPPEIGAPLTPGKSHGTKNFCSKFLSNHPQKTIFKMHLGDLFCKKCSK